MYFQFNLWVDRMKNHFKKKKNIWGTKLMKTYGIIFLQWNFDILYYCFNLQYWQIYLLFINNYIINFYNIF
jgi:hypothetical protein